MLIELIERDTWAGDEFNVVSFQNELILDILGCNAGNSSQHAHLTVELFTEEITNVYAGVGIWDGNVDGEVSVHVPHLPAVALQKKLNQLILL